jgi:DNA invertase Pin-like site-specific DNA recombinase
MRSTVGLLVFKAATISWSFSSSSALIGTLTRPRQAARQEGPKANLVTAPVVWRPSYPRISDRPALKELLDDAEKGLFDVVIVHSVDRFFCDLQGLLRALNHLQKHSVSFVSITENIDFTTPWGKLALAVLGTLAEIHIDKLSSY